MDAELTTVLVFHPKVLFLQLLNERVSDLATSTVRASCWTESGKIASWLDESVDIPQTAKFQTPAQNFLCNNVDSVTQMPVVSGGGNETIVEMSTSNLFSVIRLSSGAIYWW